jgi:hypothetical protein
VFEPAVSIELLGVDEGKRDEIVAVLAGPGDVVVIGDVVEGESLLSKLPGGRVLRPRVSGV